MVGRVPEVVERRRSANAVDRWPISDMEQVYFFNLPDNSGQLEHFFFAKHKNFIPRAHDFSDCDVISPFSNFSKKFLNSWLVFFSF